MGVSVPDLDAVSASRKLLVGKLRGMHIDILCAGMVGDSFIPVSCHLGGISAAAPDHIFIKGLVCRLAIVKHEIRGGVQCVIGRHIRRMTIIRSDRILRRFRNIHHLFVKSALVWIQVMTIVQVDAKAITKAIISVSVRQRCNGGDSADTALHRWELHEAVAIDHCGGFIISSCFACKVLVIHAEGAACKPGNVHVHALFPVANTVKLFVPQRNHVPVCINGLRKGLISNLNTPARIAVRCRSGKGSDETAGTYIIAPGGMQGMGAVDLNVRHSGAVFHIHSGGTDETAHIGLSLCQLVGALILDLKSGNRAVLNRTGSGRYILILICNSHKPAQAVATRRHIGTVSSFDDVVPVRIKNDIIQPRTDRHAEDAHGKGR